MLRVQESNLDFNFNVKAYNYDGKTSIYEKNKFCGTTAVDFLAMDRKNIYFIEVKTAQYFNVELDRLSDKICSIYRNFLDSVSLISLSNSMETKEYKTRLKNSIPKFILILSDKLPIDILMVYYEKIKKQLNKKLKRLNQDIEFLLETENNYNSKLYNIKRVQND